MTTADPRSANDLAAERTDLAEMRTMMGADRSLMAWVRTALSLLSFGFTIDKVLTGLQKAGQSLPDVNSPRNAGLFLVALGTGAMVMGTLEYWQVFRELRLMHHFRRMRPALIMALVMSVTGVLLFFGLFTRLV
jgi:putative membrane protein